MRASSICNFIITSARGSTAKTSQSIQHSNDELKLHEVRKPLRRPKKFLKPAKLLKLSDKRAHARKKNAHAHEETKNCEDHAEKFIVYRR